MSDLTSQVDADFYRLIHRLVDQEDQAAERRDALRLASSATHLVAPCSSADVPDQQHFMAVYCRDLTQAGFSFFLPTQPEFTTLVAAFGKAPNVIRVAAQITQCIDVLVYPSGEVGIPGDRASQTGPANHNQAGAHPMVLVSCRFTARLDKPTTPASPTTGS
ncbi:MAG: hypothetical protein ACYTG0_08950 [Planctomycetota bacterium]|jgi:hypothetical protein